MPAFNVSQAPYLQSKKEVRLWNGMECDSIAGKNLDKRYKIYNLVSRHLKKKLFPRWKHSSNARRKWVECGSADTNEY